MFSRKVILLALWAAACGSVPALTVLDPVVKPAIDRVPERPAPYVTPNNPAPNNPQPIKAVAYQDGRVCPKEACCELVTLPVQAPACQASYGESVGWWERGRVRRFVSAPFRWFRWRRC